MFYAGALFSLVGGSFYAGRQSIKSKIVDRVQTVYVDRVTHIEKKTDGSSKIEIVEHTKDTAKESLKETLISKGTNFPVGVNVVPNFDEKTLSFEAYVARRIALDLWLQVIAPLPLKGVAVGLRLDF